MNTRSLYKKRNITKKSYKYFKDNIDKYLSTEELSHLGGVNDMLRYKTYPKANIVSFRPKNIEQYKKKIKQH